MEKNSRIYVAGHRGLAGSAITRALERAGFSNRIERTHSELDLIDPNATRAFFESERPEYVFLAAAKVGGMMANNDYPAEFIRQNLAIQNNVIHEAWRSGVKRLLFLGSSCIYPKICPQPMKETYLLTGPLEPTNQAYAVAKIAGIEMCWSYNRQYGTRFLAAMPTNLYGPNDNYDLQKSHVLAALIRKTHEAKQAGSEKLVVWGTGSPLRDFLHSDDMGAACVFLMQLPDPEFDKLLNDPEVAPIVNLGCGAEISIRDLAQLMTEVIGFRGSLVFDPTKPDGTPRKLMDSARLLALGWRPTIALREGIRLAYEDYLRTV